MKVLVISTNVIALNPSGYSGLEYLTTKLAEGLHAKGHEVSIIGPEGSLMPEGIELITTKYREPEEASGKGYQKRLEEFECIVDASWEKWAHMSSVGRDPQLPIISWCHTVAELYNSLPAIQHPMFVGVSRDHAESISQHLGVGCRFVHNGVDVVNFYKPDPEVKRGSRYLWLARYTPEKGAAEATQLAKKLRFGLDMVGDLTIISDAGYAQRVLAQADGRQIRCIGSVTREETVRYYQKAKAYLFPILWREPFGLTPIEAMATGCPVVVMARGAMAELVEHGKSGFLCHNLAEMEEVLRKDLVSQIKPEDCIAQAQKFSLQNFVDSWSKLIEGVVSGDRW